MTKASNGKATARVDWDALLPRPKALKLVPQAPQRMRVHCGSCKRQGTVVLMVREGNMWLKEPAGWWFARGFRQACCPKCMKVRHV